MMTKIAYSMLAFAGLGYGMIAYNDLTTDLPTCKAGARQDMATYLATDQRSRQLSQLDRRYIVGIYMNKLQLQGHFASVHACNHARLMEVWR